MESIVIAYRSDNYRTVEKDTLEALKDGFTVTVDLDVLPSLEIEDMRRLISLLRRSRQTGGEFALRASRRDLRRVLAVTALDRVFTVLSADAA